MACRTSWSTWPSLRFSCCFCGTSRCTCAFHSAEELVPGNLKAFDLVLSLSVVCRTAWFKQAVKHAQTTHLGNGPKTHDLAIASRSCCQQSAMVHVGFPHASPRCWRVLPRSRFACAYVECLLSEKRNSSHSQNKHKHVRPYLVVYMSVSSS